jgi:hypothetical protein
MQKGEMKSVTMMMMMGENQSCQLQIHVTEFWGTEGQHDTREGSSHRPGAQ